MIDGRAGDGEPGAPLRVRRSKAEARSFYSRLAPWFERVEGWWESRPRERGLRTFAPRPGEHLLEIGPGTGVSLVELAARVGPEGRILGVDLAEGMLRAARGRVHASGFGGWTLLVQGDGEHLPLATARFDGVFLSFVLELFDSPEIPAVLAECRRVLRPGGRLTVVSLSLPRRPGLPVRIYTWLRRFFPRFLDCRPLPIRRILEEAGLASITVEDVRVAGLPVAIASSISP